MNVINNTEIKS